MSSYNALVELETLFIEKLQEKYKLNKRDLKKAFSRFDLDNNGLLDLNELCKGFQLLLNGVKESQIQDLVACYDVNGDGKISYEEFLEFLTKRNAIREDAFSDSDSRPSTASSSYYEEPVRQYNNNQRMDDRYYEDYDSQSSSTVYTEESVEPAFHRVRPEYPSRQQKGYSSSGRQYPSGRDERRYDNRAAEAERANQRYRDYPPPQQQHHQQQLHGSSRRQQGPYAYAESDGGSDIVPPPSRGSEMSNMDIQNPKELEYRAKVYFVNLKNYLLKKAHDMRLAGKIRTSETMKYSELQETHSRELLNKIFQPYTGHGEGRMRAQYLGVEFNDFSKILRSFNFPGIAPIRNEVIQFIFNLCNVTEDGAIFRNEEGRLVANHNVFSDLIFGIPVNRKDVKARGIVKVNNGLEETSQSIEQEFDTGLNLKGFAQKMETGREVVGTGPVRLSNATDAKVEKAMESLSVPLRFISRKSRTALAVPSSFDPLTMIRKSNQLPNYDLVRKHVFGLSTSTYSGNTLYVLPATPSSFSSRHNHTKGMRATARQYAQRNSSDYIDGATLVYASAGLGVVHNLAENTQLYFDGHKDDITCIAVSIDGTLAATGCMGKEAVVHVWTTDISLRNAKTSIATLGKGFFKRGVCAIEFSYDNVYLICVGCDDQHMMGIFHIATGAKLLEQTTQNGIPPMIKFMSYCPAPQYTEYISREHAGMCDVFATAGDHHIRVWSFRRPSVDGDTTMGSSSLTYKGLTIGKAAISAAKCNLCVGFIYCEDKTYDLVSGGSNGVVYLYRRGVLTVYAQVLRGRVQCLVVTGDRIIVGGAGGKLKILDGRTLSTVQDFSLLGSVSTGSVKPSSSGGGGNRPKSAPRARPSSSAAAGRGGAAGAVATARPSTAAPTHAAGGDVRPRGNGNIISNNADASDAGTNDEEETSGKKMVTGIAVVRGNGRSAAQGTYVIASLGTGKVVRVDIGSASPVPVTPRPGSSSYREQAAAVPYYGKDLFHFHTGAVYGLAVDNTSSRRLIATVCDDRKLMVWDAEDCALLAKAVTQNPSRCCHFDRTSRFIAVGSTNGSITVHFLSGSLDAGGNYFRIDEVAYRKDAKAEATVVKFSPSNTMIALGSRDDHIYLYSCNLIVEPVGSGRNIVENGSCVLKAMHRLRGHSATITHLDWSIDSLLLQSTCGAYELLCWDVETGRANTSVNVADVKWKTRTCVLGFSVMGIWPMYADGTDINSVDVNTEKGIVVTANDAGGLVKLFNYPCVVKNAPGKEYTGHSSHVTAVRLMPGGDTAVTTGGNDSSVVVWDVVYDSSVDNPDQFR